MDEQLKNSSAKETGICNVREELYSQCMDELIRQITINCLQRGELLNHIKEQMKETINYYQKLYESSMGFAMRQVLRETKKKNKLEKREKDLLNDISSLKASIDDKEKEINEKQRHFEEQLNDKNVDHEELIKNLKDGIENKKKKLKEILTTPKIMAVAKK